MHKLITPAFIAFAAAAMAPAAHADDAGSCHFQGSKPAAEATVVGCATQRKDSLVKSGKLDPTWQPVRHDSAALVDGKKGKEWKVTFKNTGREGRGQGDPLHVLHAGGQLHRREFHGPVTPGKRTSETGFRFCALRRRRPLLAAHGHCASSIERLLLLQTRHTPRQTRARQPPPPRAS
jgi:hypothetical protein